MTKKELYDYINSLAGDIDFEYQGIHGAVCPFSRTDIAISYGDIAKTYDDIETALNDKLFNGKSLNEIAEDLILW